MSIQKKSIAVFSNLPSGGANELFASNIKYLMERTNCRLFIEEIKKPRNFLEYLYVSTIKLPLFYSRKALEISDKFDVVLTYHSWLTKSPYILRSSKIPKVYICHEPMREYSDSFHIKSQTIKEKIVNILRIPIKMMDMRNLKSPNMHVIVNSKFSKRVIDKYYGIKSRVVYPGINVEDYYPKRNNVKENQVISVGAINRLKGFDFLIKVIAKIDINKRPSLVIVGNGVDRKYLEKMRQLSQLLNVNLIVKINISKTELISEYHRSRAFIYSPVNEPFGIVVEEAMASGLPILAYGMGGGYAEIIKSSNGTLMYDKNPDLWAQRLVAMMTDKINYSNIKYIKDNYSDKKMNANILELINSL